MPQQDKLSLSPALDALIDGCVAGLEANLSADPPTLWDPHSKQATPPSHYAHCSLALALHQRKPDSTNWQKALDAYLAIPKQSLGHHPFNRLLLLLLRDALEKDNPLAAERISTALQRCPLARRYPSNNWTLLAQLCRILEGRTNTRTHQRAVANFERLLTRWMTPAGGFIDYPAKPKDGKGSTPIAYHHKALFLTTVAVLYGGAHALAPRLQVLLNWAIQWIDKGGLCGGFGRTNHGLFGDACLLASMTLLYRSGACTNRNLNDALSRISVRLLRQQRDDGLIWLTPAGKAGWDDYMHLSVYDAWFAATVAWASHTHAPKCSHTIEWTEPTEGLFSDETAGLLAWRVRAEHGLLEAMISTTGQPPQGFAATEAELRYAAGTVFNLTIDGKSFMPPPIRVGIDSLKKTPWLAGTIPVFEFDGRLYGFTAATLDTVFRDSTQLTLNLSGSPVALSSYSNRRGSLTQLVAAIDWRLLGHRISKRRTLDRPKLSHLLCKLQLIVSANPPHLRQTLKLHISSKANTYFINPRARSSIRYNATTLTQLQPYPSSLPGSHCISDNKIKLSSVPNSLESTFEIENTQFLP